MKKLIILITILAMSSSIALAQKEMVVKMNNNTSQEFIINDINEVTYRVLCPDENHPHMIDLGLPSGTKWACCNIGASLPEEYGGYYSWGETEEKDYYDIEHYIYWYGPTGGQRCDYIGDDIASTKYDVAYVKWGAPWHIPTDAQQDELRWNCTKEWTQLNGVYGILVIGPNDAAIFMPAAGCRARDFLYSERIMCIYWSSSFYPNEYYQSTAWSLYSEESYLGSDTNFRWSGQSVRAVCP